jgi:sortase (surface protein transpeptidase)
LIRFEIVGVVTNKTSYNILIEKAVNGWIKGDRSNTDSIFFKLPRAFFQNVLYKGYTLDKEKALQDNLVTYKDQPKMGETIGLLSIPSLKAELPIIHGTDEDNLEKGVGDYANSVLPGENDNSVLAGHRDTVFRKLGDLKIGDLLVTKTKAG